ncbi:hypothetical protein V8E52_008078 [Russula decolorans]
MIFGSDGELNLWTVRDRSWNTWLMARLRMRASAACQTCLWYGFTSFLRVVRVHDVPSRLVESSRTIWVCLQYIPFFNVVLNPCLLYYSSLLSQLRSPTNPMRLIALVTVALAVSASALPRIVFERDLGNNARRGSDSDLDPQTSLTLQQRVISTNFEQNGSANGTAGQEPSLTSSNNFINFCLTINLPLANGQQIKGGSCNTAPMGVIAPSINMPSSKFITPNNLDAIQANTTFQIKMSIRHSMRAISPTWTRPTMEHHSS